MPWQPPGISNCQIDLERLEVIKNCMETYGVANGGPDNEWPWNVISKDAVAYSCGAIRRAADVVTHKHDPAEVALCRRLSGEIAKLMEATEIGMGSASTEFFRPYFLAAQAESQSVAEVTEILIRTAAFGGTIYPPAKVLIEPLKENGEWWQAVTTDGEEIGGYLKPWRSLIDWMNTHPELHGAVFLMIGDDPLDEDLINGGCVFPRMAIALTKAGSLVGIGSWVVHA